MFGKEKCILIRKIRQRINDNIDLDCESHICFFDYGCTYKCPDYKNELKLLEDEINKRRNGLKKVRINGSYFICDKLVIHYDVERRNRGFVGHIPDEHIISDDITGENIISNNDKLQR